MAHVTRFGADLRNLVRSRFRPSQLRLDSGTVSDSRNVCYKFKGVRHICGIFKRFYASISKHDDLLFNSGPAEFYVDTSVFCAVGPHFVFRTGSVCTTIGTIGKCHRQF